MKKMPNGWRWMVGLLLFGAAGSAVLVPQRQLEGLLLLPLLLIVGLCWARRAGGAEQWAFVWCVFALAFGLRVAFSFGLELIWPAFETGGDGYFYSTHSAHLAAAWHQHGWTRYADAVPFPIEGASGYVYLCAVVAYLLGPNTLLIKLINALFGAVATVYVLRLGTHLWDVRIGRGSALLTATMPSLLLWTSQNLKDALVLLLVLWALWSASQISLRRLPTLLALIAVLLTVRREMAIGLVLVIAAALLVRSVVGRPHHRWTTIGSVLVLGAALALAGYGAWGSAFIGEQLTPAAIAQRQAQTAFGGSAIHESTGGVADLPRAAMTFLLRPFPWEATGSTAQLLTIPESLLWYPLFGLALLGLLHTWRTNWHTTALVWGYTVATTLAAAPLYGNLGTAYRHRVQVWPGWFMLALVGWYALHDARRSLPAPLLTRTQS